MKRKKRKVIGRARNRNRKWDAPTNVWAKSTPVAAFVALFVFGMIVRSTLAHHCRALNREIGRLETEQRSLVEKLVRERVRWDQLKTPRNLETALSRHGVAMGYPAGAQVVYMQPGSLPGDFRESEERPVYAAR